ncbi:MAG: UPF0262 family protein [Pseudomonadota bacterium]
MTHLAAVSLDESTLPAPSPELDQERRIAIFDLVEANTFAPKADPSGGPFHLSLTLRNRRVVFALTTAAGEALEFDLPLAPLAQAIRDYHTICASYFAAVSKAPVAEIEALDQGRRDIHTEGARLLTEALRPHAEVDSETARRLFTLVSVLETSR